MARNNQVIVSPITGSGSSSSVIALAQALADSTGGTQFSSSTSAMDVAYAITEQVLAACASYTDCNGNGVLDECDLVNHPSWDFNQDGILDVCQPGTADIDPSLIPLTRNRLLQNYPNPFNPQTLLTFYLPEAERVKLSVYSLDGKHICTLLDEDFTVGVHEITWDGRDGQGRLLSSGVYFYRLTAGTYTESRQMVMIR
jgi:hypothetical protein